jgi:diguanylate cyclase (GGDEF)-like protein
LGGEAGILILVVDDDAAVREQLKKLLEAEGYRVVQAADGREALSAVRDIRPDLVLLDVVMPPPDGLEICRILKSRQQQQVFLPVILLTAKNDTDSRVAGLKLGADDYLAKPANPKELLARIEALLRIKKLQDQISSTKQQLEDQTILDPGSGLYNARYLEHRLQDEFKRAERYSEPLSCVAINLDQDQNLIRRHGREAFDKVVRELAELMRAGLREFDVLVRMNEHRFLLLLPRTHFTGSMSVATRIWKKIQAHRFEGPAGAFDVEVSMGVSFFPNKDVGSAERLLAQADEAVQKAQEAGGRQICLYQHTAYFYRPDIGK